MDFKLDMKQKNLINRYISSYKDFSQNISFGAHLFKIKPRLMLPLEKWPHLYCD